MVQEHQQQVFRTLARLVNRRENLEDLAQEVFLRLYRALPSFRGEAMLSTYLYRITVNVAQDEWKRRRRVDDPLLSLSSKEDESDLPMEERLPGNDRGAERQLLDNEFWSLVQQQMMTLSPVERAVLTMFHQEEQTYEQIAVVLSLPINTVRTHLHRARTRLRQRVEQAMTHTGRAASIQERVSL
ncbi:RNA polymerase sigma factor [Terriglobus tenax]|uniref:RNA polymerase sigma factor n=1 Tax=Terriglobus tenax TaxID=1111115 RepID=UPI0021DF5791|nr:sigma-70 family RNA polymerase sigma factor [Terriglobus tenax]